MDQVKHEGTSHYTSKMEDYHGVAKNPSSLPVDLGSFRFLGGGKHEHDYLLFSDLFEMNDDSALNVMKIRVSTESPFLRLYLEDHSVTAKLVCYDSSGLETQTTSMVSNVIATSFPADTDCLIQFNHFTNEQSYRQYYTQEKIHATIMVSNQRYLESQYLRYHTEGLERCPDNQWPLALVKNIEQNSEADEQAYYNYPLIRYP